MNTIIAVEHEASRSLKKLPPPQSHNRRQMDFSQQVLTASHPRPQQLPPSPQQLCPRRSRRPDATPTRGSTAQLMMSRSTGTFAAVHGGRCFTQQCGSARDSVRDSVRRAADPPLDETPQRSTRARGTRHDPVTPGIRTGSPHRSAPRSPRRLRSDRRNVTTGLRA
jgi:hypothetical protein